MDNWKDYVEGVRGENGRWEMNMDWNDKEKKEYDKKYYKKNKEKINKRNKKYYKKHKIK